MAPNDPPDQDTKDIEKYAYLDSFEGLPGAPPAEPGRRFQLLERARLIAPGLLVAFVIALAAGFLSDHYGAPVMLFALLIGMSVHFLAEEGSAVAGVQFASRDVLRLGVALLGTRITIDQVVSLGLFSVLIVIAGVLLTILTGLLLARLLRLSNEDGILSGGSVAICGASAALAISSVMPRTPTLERTTMLTVIGVTTLSTVAMVVYPLITTALELSETEAGLFLGATIHDVAQVVGAGYSVSTPAGDTATIVKLLRVAMLVPVVLSLGLILSRAARSSSVSGPVPLPWFLVAFVLLVAVNSTGVLPETLMEALAGFSRWCLITAIAALGIKTSFKALVVVGWRPVALMAGETVVIAAFILAAILWMAK